MVSQPTPSEYTSTRYRGSGFKHYGEAELRPDGSYVATEWFVLVSFPLVPRRSHRIKPILEKSDHGWFTRLAKDAYLEMEKLPLQWGQVLTTFCFQLVKLAWCVLMAYLIIIRLGSYSEQHPVFMILVFAASCFIPQQVANWLRHRKSVPSVKTTS